MTLLVSQDINLSMNVKQKITPPGLLFWGAVLVSSVIAITTLALAIVLFVSDAYINAEAGLVIATVGLALFTFFLWFAAALTARVAHRELKESLKERTQATAGKRFANLVNSADLALQMDNRFHSDRVLRIRHGAVMYLAKREGLKYRAITTTSVLTVLTRNVGMNSPRI